MANHLHCGITGTQRGLTPVQANQLRQSLVLFRDKGGTTIHHGDCIGADAQASAIAFDLGLLRVIHPPNNPGKRAHCLGEQILPEKPYLERNHDIVDATTILFALPGEQTEQLRSGTWATVRYARKLGRPILLLYPDGSLGPG